MHNLCAENAAEDLIAKRPRWELADIFRLYGDSCRNTHPLLPSHLKVMQAISNCRTAALGGHLYVCDSCGYEHPVYNSCGNRHCPKCQNLAKAQWLHNRMAELLPVPYFHNVFTLPHILNPIARCNKKIIYDILFSCVSKTLLQFGINPDNGITGNIGFISILHTWDQKLLEHIHLHCVIPAGAISLDQTHWIHPHYPDFLFPVQALSPVFKGKFMDEFKKAFHQSKLRFIGQSKEFQSKSAFQSLVNKLYKTNWVVYSKKPFAGPQHVLNYLSSYTHKIAISNHRIKKVENNSVTFTYRDRRTNNKIKTMSLHVNQFISRFLLHVLPHSYTRIRHFGFLSNRNRNKNISRARKLLGSAVQSPTNHPQQNTQQLMLKLTGKDITQCPHCKSGTMIVIKILPKLHPPTINTFPLPQKVFDSS